MNLPKILLHEGAGDACFLIDGWKVPAYIAPEFEIQGLGFGVVGVTVTFLADEVTVLSRQMVDKTVSDVMSETRARQIE